MAQKTELRTRLTLSSKGFVASARRAKARFQRVLIKPLQGSIEGLKNSFTNIGIGAAGLGGMGYVGFAFMDKIAENRRAFEQLSSYLTQTDAETQQLEQGIGRLNKALGLRGFAKSAEFVKQMQNLSGLKGQGLMKFAESVGFLQKSFGNDEMLPKAQLELMRRFGITTTEAADAVAYLRGQGGDLRGEALESVLEYATQFKEAGFSLQQTLGVLSNANSGWSIDKVADAFKEGRLRLMSSDKAPADALAVLGLVDLQSQIKQAKVSVPQAMQQIFIELNKLSDAQAFDLGKEIFGAPFEDAGIEAIRAALSGMSHEVKYSGEARRLRENLEQGFSLKWDRTVTELKAAFQDFAKASLPILLPIVDGLKHAFAWAGAFMRQYKNLAKLLVYSIGIVAGLGVAFFTLKIAAGMASAGLNLAKLALLPLRGGWIGLIAAGLVALAAAFTNKNFRAGFFGELSGSFKRLGEAFEKLGINIGPIKEFFQDIDWDKALGSLGKGLGQITDAVLQPFIWVVEGLAEIKAFFTWWNSFAGKVNSMSAAEQEAALGNLAKDAWASFTTTNSGSPDDTEAWQKYAQMYGGGGFLGSGQSAQMYGGGGFLGGGQSTYNIQHQTNHYGAASALDLAVGR